MSITYTRIDKNIVRQTITYDDMINDLEQSKVQKSITDEQTKLDNMPAVKPYPVNATPAEKKTIDEWNIKNSNKFEKEGLKESIAANTALLDMLEGVV